MRKKSPGGIEREMDEIRRSMEPDVADLRDHIESQFVTKQVKQTVRQRLSQAADRSKANLRAKQQELADSAKSSLSLARRRISSGRGE
ncbi:MAG: hypothetical protein CYG60_05050 [Actinobacteria bacterium]|nr:MAG: hypothetical protein CYG60_05050 [Actinomycetota bacterium]